MLLHADTRRITQSELLQTKRLAHKPRHHETEPVLTIAASPSRLKRTRNNTGVRAHGMGRARVVYACCNSQHNARMSKQEYMRTK
jgi:hypothetical protein